MKNAAAQSIRFASINIQGGKHLVTVLDFLKKYEPETVCFQELSESSISFFERGLGMKGVFAPMCRKRADDPDDSVSPGTPMGVAIFSKFYFLKISAENYYGGGGELPTFIIGDETTLRRTLLTVYFNKDGAQYTVATTHFTRTPDGSASGKQRQDMTALLKLLKSSPEVILCGDFNAPRGGEIFAVLADRYKDNIPLIYDTSLDPKLHALKGSKPLMVDGLFTTPEYVASEVKLSDGVSDHQALTALISRL